MLGVVTILNGKLHGLNAQPPRIECYFIDQNQGSARDDWRARKLLQ